MHDVVVDVVHPGNGRDRRAGLFVGFDDLDSKRPAVAAPPCVGRIKSDHVHVSIYFYVDTMFLSWLLVLDMSGSDAYRHCLRIPIRFSFEAHGENFNIFCVLTVERDTHGKCEFNF